MPVWTPESRSRNNYSEINYNSYLTGGVLLAGENPDIPVKLTPPGHTSLVVLPPVSDECVSVRLGMHTDTIGDLFSYLSQHPRQTHQLLIEARVLNKTQWRKLDDDTAYNFFIKRRDVRERASRQEKVINYLVPKGLKLTAAQADQLLRLAYAPATSAQRVGYKVGWYNAEFLCELYERAFGGTNALLPILGGVNQFRIGSDNIDPGQLKALALNLRRDFAYRGEQVADRAMALAPEITEKLYDKFKFDPSAKKKVRQAIARVEKRQKASEW